jgi:hypothetical protein
MASLLLYLVAGAAWNLSGVLPWWLAPLGALLLPWLARWQKASRRYALAAVYMAAATYSIVPSASAFFPGASVALGVGIWVVATLLLALPWALVRNAPTALLATVLSGLLGVISPWPAAGVLFPGMGLLGVVLFLLVVVLLSEWSSRIRGNAPASFWGDVSAATAHWLLFAALASNSLALARGFPAPVPEGWHAVVTHGIIPSRGSMVGSIGNTAAAVRAARNVGSDPGVLVFPEAVLDDMLPGTVAMVQSAVPPGQLWLVGAEDGKHDAVWAFERGREPVMLFDSALPMPVSMWRPGQPDSYRPAWWVPVRDIEGQRVWSALCYDQVLPWVWLEAVVQRPSLLLLQSNAWWAAPNNPAPHIQAAQARAWVRLLGLPALSATNTQSR